MHTGLLHYFSIIFIYFTAALTQSGYPGVEMFTYTYATHINAVLLPAMLCCAGFSLQHIGLNVKL